MCRAPPSYSCSGDLCSSVRNVLWALKSYWSRGTEIRDWSWFAIIWRVSEKLCAIHGGWSISTSRFALVSMLEVATNRAAVFIRFPGRSEWDLAAGAFDGAESAGPRKRPARWRHWRAAGSTANLISPPPPLPNAPCFRRSPPVTLPARSPPVPVWSLPAAVTVPARCRVGHRQSQCRLGDCSVPAGAVSVTAGAGSLEYKYCMLFVSAPPWVTRHWDSDSGYGSRL